MISLTRVDVESLAFGKAPTRAIVDMFYAHVLPGMLHTEHASHALEKCFIFPYNFFAVNNGLAYAPDVGPSLAPPSYLIFPTGGSVMLVCIPGKVFFHMDSERGVIVGGDTNACCLRGTHGLTLSTCIKRYIKYQYNHCIDVDDWPLKHVKVPLVRDPETASLFSCTIVLYLLSNLPPVLTTHAADVFHCYRNTEIDLFHTTPFQYPGFMTRQWFSPETSEALRYELLAAATNMTLSDECLHLVRTIDTENKTTYRAFHLPSHRVGRQATKRKRRLYKMSATQKHVTRWAELGIALGVQGSKRVVSEQLSILRQRLSSYGTRNDTHQQTRHVDTASAENEQQVPIRSDLNHRVYNRWMSNGKGGCIKKLTSSDLLKLRIKGDAAAEMVADTDRQVQVAHVDANEHTTSWNVGIWRPSHDKHLVSLQAGWPTVVSCLRLQRGQVLEFQPCGRVDFEGSSIPRIMISHT